MGFFNNLLGGDKTQAAGERKSSLLTASEAEFMNILLEILDSNSFLIFPKVSLDQCISLSEKERARFALDNKSIDYILCERDTFKPVLGIELDDSTHNRQETVERDLLINRVFEHAELPLIRIEVQREYNLDEIAQKVVSGLGLAHEDVILVK